MTTNIIPNQNYTFESIIILIRNFVNIILQYNSIIELLGDDSVKLRKKEYGNCNIVGKNIERIRKEKGIKQKDFISKIQVFGLDINPTSYSKLEGQIRIATDKEIYAIAKILEVDIEKLFENKI